MAKIKKNDEVIVITGKNKGKIGKVLKVEGDSLIVEGINMQTKHQRPNPKKGEQGAIVKRESSINSSNVNIYNPQTKKADGITFKILEDGKKVRCYKSTKEVIDL